MEIEEREQRRAENLIWNAADDYSFTPDFRVYDADGRAELYWNSVVGAVYRRWDRDKIRAFLLTLAGEDRGSEMEQLLWLWLERAVFPEERERRPALEALRERYALSVSETDPGYDAAAALLRGYFRRTLGLESGLAPAEEALLTALDATPETDTDSLLSAAREIFARSLGLGTGRKRKTARGVFLKLFGQEEDAMAHLAPVRGFAYGFGEHIQAAGEDSEEIHRRSVRLPRPTATRDIDMREYVTGYFGRSMFDERRSQALEKEFCTGNHRDCHLHFTRGAAEDPARVRGYAGERRRRSLEQEARNRAAYDAELSRNRQTIRRLTDRIRNSLLTRLDESEVRSSAGALTPGRVWRATELQDERVFRRTLREDTGNLSVDILLDASTSQISRQERIAAQGYIIAESLSRCGIPVRVYSFCSMNGYTILNLFRDYSERNRNENIFRYFTAGCNRDGLAIRCAAGLLQKETAEHRLLVVLSDAKPNDVMKVERTDRTYQEYCETLGVEDTAAEVHQARVHGLAVACVFTGTDEDLPAAGRIYGRHMTRIRSMDHFADAVARLLLDQIGEL